jgi:PAP2 superfamily
MKMKRVLFGLALGAGLTTLLLGGTEANAQTAPAPTQPVNPVIQWNRNLLIILRTPGVQPATIHPTRSYAIMHAAIYDAVNTIDRSHQPYLIRLPRPDRDASQDAAVDAAAHEVLVALYPTQQASLDAELTQSLAQIPDGDDKAEGIVIGQTVADGILGIRSTDGANAKPIPYVFGTAPGDYMSTPPNFPMQPQFTHWSHVTPFALERADQFRLGPPPALTSDVYSDAFNQVKSLGIQNSTTATADQQLIGLFWNGAIQNYWNEITQTASLAHKLNTAQNARLFALLNLSLADSVIAFYDSKYTYNLWRPVSAIRGADKDNNPETAVDPNWLPEGGKNTAPDPSYPGAHASISAAAEKVLITFFKQDHFDLNVTSEVLPGVIRSFNSFSGAFNEASFSRVLAGQHFSFDEKAGEHLGHEVADFVLDNFLTARDRDDDR